MLGEWLVDVGNCGVLRPNTGGQILVDGDEMNGDLMVVSWEFKDDLMVI